MYLEKTDLSSHFFVQRHFFSVYPRCSQHPFLPYLNPVGAA